MILFAPLTCSWMSAICLLSSRSRISCRRACISAASSSASKLIDVIEFPRFFGYIWRAGERRLAVVLIVLRADDRIALAVIFVSTTVYRRGSD